MRRKRKVEESVRLIIYRYYKTVHMGNNVKKYINPQHEVTPLQFVLIQRTPCELALIQLLEGSLRWCLKNLVSIAGQLVLQALLHR